jgi:4-hydroxy-tetrahydrodipicolinate reductase
MGVEIAAVLAASARFTLAHEITGGAADWPRAAEDVDVVIDFSQPAGLEAALAWCSKHRRPLVSGTTGFDEALGRKLRAAGRRIPVLHSANMSPGVAVMSAMLERLRNLEDWDFHVDEIHHRHKRDAPSGTARLLDERLRAVIGRPTPKPNSIRGGSVPGLHQVWAMGEDEVLLIQHTALDRRVFARGAVRAAGWLFDKAEPGFYDLMDLYTT